MSFALCITGTVEFLLLGGAAVFIYTALVHLIGPMTWPLTVFVVPLNLLLGCRRNNSIAWRKSTACSGHLGHELTGIRQIRLKAQGSAMAYQGASALTEFEILGRIRGFCWLMAYIRSAALNTGGTK